jgi:hypothetical protein
MPPASAPSGGGRAGLFVLLALVAVVAVITIVGKSGTKVREVKGTIIFLDLASREGAIEVIDPNTKQSKEYAGKIPENTSVTIGGKEASLADLAEGDEVTLRYTVDRRTRDIKKVEVFKE